jgi:hypothetical protein
MAKPMADSAAATVKINSENTCPIISSKYTEKIIKLKLIANNINSIDINIIIIFFRVIKIPNIPKMNSIVETIK